MEEINYVKIAAYLGAALVMGIGTIGPSISQGMVGAKAVESMSQSPQMADKIRGMLIISLSVIETIAIYAFVVAIILLFGIGA